MEPSYLERLLELLEKLQSAYLQKGYKEAEVIQQQIERHIGSLEKFVDMLRNCQGKYSCHNDHTVRAIECASSAQRKYGGGGIYPALWFDFAHENFLSELKRWIKEETNSKIARVGKEDLQNGKTIETKQKAEIGKGRRAINWIKKHPHSYGLTGGVILLIIFSVLGLLKSQWRSWCWGTAVIAFLVLILSLLGGKSR